MIDLYEQKNSSDEKIVLKVKKGLGWMRTREYNYFRYVIYGMFFLGMLLFLILEDLFQLTLIELILVEIILFILSIFIFLRAKNNKIKNKIFICIILFW